PERDFHIWNGDLDLCWYQPGIERNREANFVSGFVTSTRTWGIRDRQVFRTGRDPACQHNCHGSRVLRRVIADDAALRDSGRKCCYRHLLSSTAISSRDWLGNFVLVIL